MKRIQQPEITRDRDDQPVIDGVTYLRPSNLAKFIEDRTDFEKYIVNVLRDAAIHAATEAVDYGEDISYMPADLQADALAYRAARKSLGLYPTAAEVFVVNDTIGAAGTFDRLVVPVSINEPALGLITDIKTGSKDDPEYAARYNAVAWSIQLATYAHARPLGTSWTDLEVSGLSLSRGIVWYIPRGLGKCYPIHLDLEAGWSLAQTAKAVYDARKSSPVLSINEAVSA